MLAVAGLGWSGSLKRVLRKKAARIEATSGDNLLVSFWDWKQITQQTNVQMPCWSSARLVIVVMYALFWQHAQTHQHDQDWPSSYQLPLPNHQYKLYWSVNCAPNFIPLPVQNIFYVWTLCLFVCSFVFCFQTRKTLQFSEAASVDCCLLAHFSKEGLLPSVASSSLARDPVHKRKG